MNGNQGLVPNITQLPTCKVVATDCPKDFEKQFNDLVRAGWNFGNINVFTHWDEKAQKMVYGYNAIALKNISMNNG